MYKFLNKLGRFEHRFVQVSLSSSLSLSTRSVRYMQYCNFYYFQSILQQLDHHHHEQQQQQSYNLRRQRQQQQIQQQKRLFHTTISTNVPVTRRRRGLVRGEDGKVRQGSINNVNVDDNQIDDDILLQRSATVTDKVIFEIEAKKEVLKLMQALRPLELINDPFVLTETTTDTGLCIEIDLGPVDGKYTIEFIITNDKLELQFNSPLSGQFIYRLHVDGDWCSVADGHHFEGLLVRDLIRKVQGVPNL